MPLGATSTISIALAFTQPAAGPFSSTSQCILEVVPPCRPADVLRQAGIVVAEPGWEKHLFDMMRYAETHQLCRRATIARCSFISLLHTGSLDLMND